MGQHDAKKIRWWNCPRMWVGATVFIIGGGPSLAAMDLTLIHERRCIGCNDAYALGSWVDVCYFGDWIWYTIHNHDVVERPDGSSHNGLRRFAGLKVTVAPDDKQILDPSIKRLRRQPRGISVVPNRIAWNTNTGASAINLALKLGASRAVLLGFDMALGDEGQANWHINLKDKPDPESYERFLGNMKFLVQGLEDHPEFEVLNATPGSKLTLFPMVKLEDVA